MWVKVKVQTSPAVRVIGGKRREFYPCDPQITGEKTMLGCADSSGGESVKSHRQEELQAKLRDNI